MIHPRRIAGFGLITLLAGCSFGDAMLEVGPNARFKLPSEAIARAHTGDVIQIAPGNYTDCAVIRASRLTIEATGEGATIGDRSCAGKGTFVVDGNDITVRNITFRHAKVPDHNGAGIRAEGRNLTVEHCKFIDNENGILANSTGGDIRILDSDFRGNGKCEGACAHGIYVNAIDRLEIAHSHFIDQHVGHHVKSRARTTVLTDNDITDGPNGNSSYLIDIPNGGDVLIQGNRLQKGRMAENSGTAVPIGEEGVKNPTHELVIHDNRFVSDLPNETVFVRNQTATPAVLSGNHLQGRIKPLLGPGDVSP
jgi:hypothetical protein